MGAIDTGTSGMAGKVLPGGGGGGPWIGYPEDEVTDQWLRDQPGGGHMPANDRIVSKPPARGGRSGGPAAPPLPGHGNPYPRFSNEPPRPTDVPRYADGGAVNVDAPENDFTKWTEDQWRHYTLTGERPKPPAPPQPKPVLPPYHMADGGAVPHFDYGGTTNFSSQPQGQQQPFGYDPTAYVTNATNWANNWYGNNTQQYQWAQDQFNKNAGTSDLVTQAALKSGDIFQNAANAGVSRYEQMYAPAMQQQLEFARNYTSPAEMARARGASMAGVGQGFDAQAKSAGDALRLQGLDPNTVGARLDSSVRTQRAASEAAAGTSSDINRELVGQQLLSGAIQTGQADAGVTTQFGGMGTANRNQAVNTGLATTASGSATMGTPMQWASMAGQELKEWPKAELDAMTASNQQGSLWNDINKTNLQAQQQAANTGSGWGALIGAGLGAAGTALGGPLGGMLGSSIGNMFGSAVTSGGGGGSKFAAHGGAIDAYDLRGAGLAHGDIVPPQSSLQSIKGPDKVPAMLQSGEGVVPKDVMDYIGHEGFHKMIQSVHKRMGKPNAPIGPETKPMPQEAIQTGPTFASRGAMMQGGGAVSPAPTFSGRW